MTAQELLAKFEKQRLADVNRTPALDCLDCQTGHWHSEENWKQFHPNRGCGVAQEIPKKA
jgi:hypothetical protein